jgi:hypothetical protein
MNSFFLQKFLSSLLIAEVIFGRAFNQKRSDSYDVSVVSGIFLYWKKSPATAEKEKQQEVENLRKDYESAVYLLKQDDENGSKTNSSSEEKI